MKVLIKPRLELVNLLSREDVKNNIDNHYDQT